MTGRAAEGCSADWVIVGHHSSGYYVDEGVGPVLYEVWEVDDTPPPCAPPPEFPDDW